MSNPMKGFKPTPEKNSGLRHPDFDFSVVTSIADYYRRFAADPEFKVKKLPEVYDLNEGNGPITDEDFTDLDEPELGEVDLEYFDPSKHAKNDQTKNASEKVKGQKDTAPDGNALAR